MLCASHGVLVLPHCSFIVVDANKEWNPPLLHLILDAAARSAPELRPLEFNGLLNSNGDGNELLLSISALTGLESSTFDSLIFCKHFRIRDILDLCRLQCLEVWLDPRAAKLEAATNQQLSNFLLQCKDKFWNQARLCCRSWIWSLACNMPLLNMAMPCGAHWQD